MKFRLYLHVKLIYLKFIWCVNIPIRNSNKIFYSHVYHFESQSLALYSRIGIVVEPCSIRALAADYPILTIFKHSRLVMFHTCVVVCKTLRAFQQLDNIFHTHHCVRWQIMYHDFPAELTYQSSPWLLRSPIPICVCQSSVRRSPCSRIEISIHVCCSINRLITCLWRCTVLSIGSGYTYFFFRRK